MIDTASQPLCQELYELLGWEDCALVWYARDGVWEWHLIGNADQGISLKNASNAFTPDEADHFVPAYTLGYLMRKLPERTDYIRDTVLLGRATGNKGWSIVYRNYTQIADTSEDAACLLAIALAKAGILKREES